MQRTRRRIIACEGDERREGSTGSVDEVRGEQRRSVSFIAHSRPLREGLTSQGLRGKLVVLSCASSLVGCLLALLTSLSGAAGKSDDTSPPAVACHHHATTNVLCAMSSTRVPHSLGVTRHHVGQWVPSSPCSLMRDGWMRIAYQSILHSIVVVVPENVRSSLRNQS